MQRAHSRLTSVNRNIRATILHLRQRGGATRAPRHSGLSGSHCAFMPPNRTGPSRAGLDARLGAQWESWSRCGSPFNHVGSQMTRRDQRMRGRLGKRGSVSARLAAFAPSREGEREREGESGFSGLFSLPFLFNASREATLLHRHAARGTRFLLIPRKRAAREDPGGLPHRSARLDHVTIPGSPRRNQNKRERKR